MIGHCDRTVQAANHIKSARLNQPITELITVTTATTTYLRKTAEFPNEGIFNFRHYHHLMQFYFCSRCICFYRNCNGDD